ncbi:hypothetical protein M011DRAFT_444825 [Sporormia fimetaria CBS 119925]|uniref:Uncharacterized protein n=1 Tax=Sporormia fimetaria CBS 119925 TaxID=1340428 RepID=A0A6A6VA36_9PLEO|nr:hypothetical protein M011DRAFT_444825 [Sporormia fimetaria CBS 119925]
MSNNDPNSSSSSSSDEQKSYTQTATEYYHKQYNNWVPWMEEQYLKYFSKDNKASYGLKETLSSLPQSSDPDIQKIQSGLSSLVSQQIGQGGVGEPVGDEMSAQITEQERRGSGSGSGLPPVTGENLGGGSSGPLGEAAGALGGGLDGVGGGGVVGGGKKTAPKTKRKAGKGKGGAGPLDDVLGSVEGGKGAVEDAGDILGLGGMMGGGGGGKKGKPSGKK